jgi:phosphinothricin acetyltransferase
MEIRHADADRDAAGCAAIYDPFVHDTVISLEQTPPGARGLAERITRISRTHPWLVADDGGCVLGYAYGSEHQERAGYRWAADVAVYVDPDRHRRGVGRSLYTALFELLARQGLQVVCAGITLPNDASVGLHESLGFTPVGVYRAIAWKHGAWWDVGWWQRQLSPSLPQRPAEPRPPVQ